LPNEGSLSPSTRQRASTGKRPRALDRLEEFCSLAQRFATGDIIERTLATLDGSYVSLIPTMKAWIQGSFASEDKLSQSLDPYFLQCGADSRALSTEDMVYVEIEDIWHTPGVRADVPNQGSFEPV
jgi:hypothetical protein